MEGKQKICVLKRVSVIVISGEKIKILYTVSCALRDKISCKYRVGNFMNQAYSFLVAADKVELNKRVNRYIWGMKCF